MKSGRSMGLRVSIQVSVTVQPASDGFTSYSHVAPLMGPTPRLKLSLLGGVASLMVTVPIDHFFLPLTLLPLSLAPTVAEVAPPFHLPPTFSGLHSPILLK